MMLLKKPKSKVDEVKGWLRRLDSKQLESVGFFIWTVLMERDKKKEEDALKEPKQLELFND